MRSHAIHSALVLPLLLGLALPASGTEVKLGARTGVEFDSNLFATETDENEEWSGVFRPSLEVNHEAGDFSGTLRYRPTFEYYLQESSLRGWDHEVLTNGEWRPSPRTRLELSNVFLRFHNLNALNQSVIGLDGVPAVESAFGRERLTRNQFNALLSHQLAPRHSFELGAGHGLFDYSDRRRDRQDFYVNGRYTYTLNPRNQIGVGASWSHQTFDETDTVDEANTDYYNLSAIWVHTFDPTFQIRASAGPTLITNSDPDDADPTAELLVLPLGTAGDGTTRLLDASSCAELGDGTPILGPECEFTGPALGSTFTTDSQIISPTNSLETFGLIQPIDSSSDTNVTFFADIALTKEWDRWNFLLSYRREDDSGSGLGVASVADIVQATLGFRPSPRWSFRLNGLWVRREREADSLRFAAALGETSVVTCSPPPSGFGLGFCPAVPPFSLTTTTAATTLGLRGQTVDNDSSITTYRVAFTANYRLTKRSSLTGRMSYVDQESKRTFADVVEYDRFRVSIFFDYSFDPIRL